MLETLDAVSQRSQAKIMADGLMYSRKNEISYPFSSDQGLDLQLEFQKRMEGFNV
jgi:hypothetical protein